MASDAGESSKPSDAPNAPEPTPPSPSFHEQFAGFAKFGDTHNAGDNISLKNIDKWMKQTGVFGKTPITSTDTGIYFKQLAKNRKGITEKEFLQFLENLCKARKLEVNDIKTKLCDGGPPALSGTTQVVKNNAVSRLTDTSKYTGSHKNRFDADGKGVGGKEKASNTGYVQGYKEAGKYAGAGGK